MSWNRSALAAILIASSSLTLWGCGSSSEILAQTKQCTVDADCTGSGWCLDGVCQTPYGLTLSIDKAPSADGKIHANGALSISVAVTGGTPPVEIALVDEKRLQLVAAPYSWQWDVKAAEVTEGSHRVIATAKGGTRTYSSQSIEVIVDRIAPPTPVVNPVASPTNEAKIVLTGTGEEKTTVRVVEGTTELASVPAINAGSWRAEVAGLSEGTHVLAVTAKDLAGNVSGPAEVTVLVDLTHPTVLSRSPEPGVSNVWSRDPIQVTFSEDMALPAPGSVLLTATPLSGAGTPTAVPISLSLSGRTLTIRSQTLPPVPSKLAVTFNDQLRDLAGNAVIIPGEKWEWTLPSWQDLGSANQDSFYVPVPRIGLSMDGRPSVATSICDSQCGTSLSEWTGAQGWAKRLDDLTNRMASGWQPSVDVDQGGRPAMAWEGSSCINSVRCATSNISSGRWDGASFEITKTISGPGSALSPTLRIDALGNHVVAWLENEANTTKVYARMWNGDWMTMGSPMSTYSTARAFSPTVSVDSKGNARVDWLEDAGPVCSVKSATWSHPDNKWVASAGGFLNGGGEVPSGTTEFKVSPSGVYGYYAYADTTTTPGVSILKVRQLSCLGPPACENVVLGSAVRGGSLNVDAALSASQFALALDPDGYPVVAWTEGPDQQVYVKRWSSTDGAWLQLGNGNIANTSNGTGGYNPSVAVSRSGIVGVAFSQGKRFLGAFAGVKRYNGDWSLSAEAPVSVPDAQPPAIVTQPASKTVTVGSAAAFQVAAYGPAPMTWQWRRNGTSIPGATGSTYTTAATTYSDSGSRIDVVITGRGGGTVTSDAATLTVTPREGHFTATGNLAVKRNWHTATLLPSGKVLVAGGYNGQSLTSAELYDPATGTFAPTGNMTVARNGHSATLLASGLVLVAGGRVDAAGASAELYDPATGAFVPTGSMTSIRTSHGATRLLNGRVLITGGCTNSPGCLSSAELYDPTTRTFTGTGSMNAVHYEMAALLPSGRVLVTGPGTTAEVYDPATGVFALAGSMTYAHELAIPLADGRVLLAGGGVTGATGVAEIYDPSTGKFTLTGSMSTKSINGQGVRMASGKVLITGGYDSVGDYDSAEIYDPATGLFTATGTMIEPRASHSITLLAGGNVLVVGGANTTWLATSEIYVP